jgi:hypothetical protein
VSLLLRDQLRIKLSPEMVAMVRLGRGFHPEVVARNSITCAAPSHDEAAWAKVLAGLEALLSTMEGEKIDAVVTLSNHFVRYALVPWNEQINDPGEEQAFIRLCFTQIYGADAKLWALRASPAGYGETRVACAIDQGLLEGVERVAAAHGVRLVSLQPYLMSMFNQWCGELQGSSAWFVVAEPGRLCISQLQQARWHTVRTIKVGDDWQHALQKLLEREYLISDSATERGAVYLYAPGMTAATDFPGWEVHRLGATGSAAAAAHQS